MYWKYCLCLLLIGTVLADTQIPFEGPLLVPVWDSNMQIMDLDRDGHLDLVPCRNPFNGLLDLVHTGYKGLWIWFNNNGKKLKPSQRHIVDGKWLTSWGEMKLIQLLANYPNPQLRNLHNLSFC